MRALVVSYGDISILTLSPTTRRMKRFLILPEMCASTSCPPTSSTLNIVPARTETIVPSISTDLSSRPSSRFFPLLSWRPPFPPRRAGAFLAGLFGFPAIVSPLLVDAAHETFSTSAGGFSLFLEIPQYQIVDISRELCFCSLFLHHSLGKPYPYRIPYCKTPITTYRPARNE